MASDLISWTTFRQVPMSSLNVFNSDTRVVGGGRFVLIGRLVIVRMETSSSLLASTSTSAVHLDL